MPTATSIQGHINKGYRKFAQVGGDAYAWYRPTAATNPLSTEALLGTLRAQFATDTRFLFLAPAEFEKAAKWFVSFEEQAELEGGDYLVGRLGTFYIADVERFAPVQAVWCNRIVEVARMEEPLVAGASTSYGGESALTPNLTVVLSGWPANLRQLGAGAKMRSGEMGQPTDAPTPGMQLTIPSLTGAELKWNDVVVDDLGRRYVVSSLELSTLGWRAALEQWPGV